MTEQRILRFAEVIRVTGLSELAIRAGSRNGRFPPAVRLGVRAIGWRSDDVSAFVEKRWQQGHVLIEPPADFVTRIHDEQRLRVALDRVRLLAPIRWAWPQPGQRGWRDHLRAAVGDGPCTYIARNDRFVIYVGESSVGWPRLVQHRKHWLSRHPAMTPAFFDVIKVATPAEAARLEARLIAELYPALNRQTPQEIV